MEIKIVHYKGLYIERTPDNEIINAQGQNRNFALLGALLTIIGVKIVKEVQIANLIKTHVG